MARAVVYGMWNYLSGPLPKHYKSWPWCGNRLYVVFLGFHTEIKKEIFKNPLVPNRKELEVSYMACSII